MQKEIFPVAQWFVRFLAICAGRFQKLAQIFNYLRLLRQNYLLWKANIEHEVSDEDKINGKVFLCLIVNNFAEGNISSSTMVCEIFSDLCR